MKKPRPLCLVCGKPISTENCGVEKKAKSIELKIDEAELETALAKRLKDKGIILPPSEEK